ncbi:MAG: carboxypeptidase-like regulatory domain-containing protein [Bergeyella sp.]|nr:carboxypeptidase-like regulatory domain-containing protein [Bergeyella sp.]
MKKKLLISTFFFFVILFRSQVGVLKNYGEENLDKDSVAILVKDDSDKFSSEKRIKELTIIAKPKKHLSKKENPAYRILQGIWENKERNRLENQDFYEYKKYSLVTTGLNNLDSILMKKILEQDYAEIKKILTQGENREISEIPIFRKEMTDDVYGSNFYKKERVDREGERKLGISDGGFGIDMLSDSFMCVDVYNDDLRILDKSFVSPLSTGGYSVYDYVLRDSVMVGDKTEYKVYFFPKTSEDILFQGFFTVVDRVFALSYIRMNTTKHTNLNLVRRLSIEKEFAKFGDNLYLPKKETIEGDFTFLGKKSNKMGLSIKKDIYYYNYVLNKSRESSFYDDEKRQTYKGEYNKSERYWDGITVQNNIHSEDISVLSKLKSQKKIKALSSIFYVFSTGYLDVARGLQAGPVWKYLSDNDIEGFKVRLAFRTFFTKNDKLRTYFYGAYGTEDRKFKYGVCLKYLVSSVPRLVLEGSRVHDYFQLGSQLYDDQDLIPRNSNAFLRRGNNYFLTDMSRNSLSADLGIKNNFHVIVSNVYREMKSADPSVFSVNYTLGNLSEKSSIKDFSASISVIYTPKRRAYGYGVEQKIGKRLFTTLKLKYIQGFRGFLESDFSYSKLLLSVQKPFFLSKYGVLKTNFMAGKIFGTLPILLLSPIPTDQSYSLEYYSFSLLNYYNYVTDSYLTGYMEHHFNGFILNKIPLVRDLGLRSLIFYRYAIGSVSDDNIRMNRSTVQYVAPEKLYYEYGFGIENIGYRNIRPIRVDFSWRGSADNYYGIPPANFAIRFGFSVDF